MNMQDNEIKGNMITDAEAANMMCDFVEFLNSKLGEDVVSELIQEYNNRFN